MIGEIRSRTGDLRRSEPERIVRAVQSRIPCAHSDAKLHRNMNVSKGHSAVLQLDMGEPGWSSLKFGR